MLFIQIVHPTLLRDLDDSGNTMLWVAAHTQVFFPLLLMGLMLVVELGFRLRRATGDISTERQSLIESARSELGVLLGLLLGFSLPMALPHYEHRNQLVIDEANAITNVRERAQLLPEPYRNRILSSLGEYVAARVEFGESTGNRRTMLDSVARATSLQNQMWEETTRLVQQKPNIVTPVFVQALDQLPSLIEQRQAAEEKRVQVVIWLVVILISGLTCFVVGYSMRQRFVLGMLVVPLTVAVVLSLVSELDNPRTGFVHDSQESVQRLYLSLSMASAPASDDSKLNHDTGRDKGLDLAAEGRAARESHGKRDGNAALR